MSEALYHKALVERARAAFGKGRLPDATSSATVDNPLCGDRVTLDLTVKDGRIAAIGHQVTTLKRVRFGGLELGRLAPGEWRDLTRTEVEAAFPARI